MMDPDPGGRVGGEEGECWGGGEVLRKQRSGNAHRVVHRFLFFEEEDEGALASFFPVSLGDKYCWILIHISLYLQTTKHKQDHNK